MLPLPLENVNSVLCLGAHADDIEIGCGGTLLALLDARPELEVTWIVFVRRTSAANDVAGRSIAVAS